MTALNVSDERELARIERLLRRLDPAESEPCTVSGCLHLGHGVIESGAVALLPAA